MPSRSVTSALRTIVVARRSLLEQLAIGVVLATGFTILRWQIDGGRLGLQFASCFPAVVLASILLEPVLVALVAFGSIAFAQWLLVGEGWFNPPDAAHIAVALYFVGTVAAMTAIGAGLRVALAEAESLSAQKDLLNAELRTRIRTGFGLIGDLACAKDRKGPAVGGRPPVCGLAVLAGACEILGPELTDIRRMSEVVQLALAPFGTRERITAAGPDLALPRSGAIPVALALHELATNAMRIGALANDVGIIDVRWTDVGKQRFMLVWQERDVPLVSLSQRDSFGADLLTDIPGVVSVSRSFHPHGFRCEIVIAEIRESTNRISQPIA